MKKNKHIFSNLLDLEEAKIVDFIACEPYVPHYVLRVPHLLVREGSYIAPCRTFTVDVTFDANFWFEGSVLIYVARA